MKKSKKLLSSLALSAIVLLQSIFLVSAQDSNTKQLQSQSTENSVQAKNFDASTFSWDNATVYFMLTDRFENGDNSNDNSYGRELDINGNAYSNSKSEPATFHGGDLKGVTNKINEGYFTDLGVNVIWITAPYEQIHGWLGADGFRHYAYHGYYTLDYTNVDANMGTAEDLKTFIDTAHENGIRVVFDVVMNHAGYATLKDMDEFGFGELVGNWKDYYYGNSSNAYWSTDYSYINKSSSNWSNWWGTQWVRASQGFNGYEGAESGSDLEMCLSGLPDFRTESTYDPGIPKLLENKWKQEGRYEQEKAELDSFFDRTGLNRQVSNYIVKWLTDWVREYGVDGFRVDTAKHVQLDAWATLKEEAVDALREWKSNNPDKALDDLDFWMTGEVWGHGVSSSSAYFSNGFDSVINFGFKDVPKNMNSLESTYKYYADTINSNDDVNYLSYISSHDTSLYDRGDLVNAGTALLLAPGAVQIFYGDETARPLDYFDCSYADQKYRSDMNWDSINQTVLTHWQKIGQFRNNHVAVGAGQHNMINSYPYTFSRTYEKNGVTDAIIAVVGAQGNTTVDVSSVFGNGAILTNAYTGETATVVDGKVTFSAGSHGVILIEGDNDQPTTWIDQNEGRFYTDSLTVTLNYKNAVEAQYSLNGSTPVSFNNGQAITFGESDAFDTEYELKLTAVNEDGVVNQKLFKFIKSDPDQVLTVHYYKPSSWGTPNIYYYDETITPTAEDFSWPGVKMVDEGNGWYSYSIPLWEQASVIFNSGGNQIPGVQQPGYFITEESWIKDGEILTDDPTRTTPVITLDASNNEFYTDKLTLSPKISKADSVYYTINGGQVVKFTTGDKITIGENDPIGTEYNITITASNIHGTSSKTFNFIKVEEPETKTITVNFYKPSSWDAPNIYFYDETVTPVKMGSEWPGFAMTDVGDGWYSYTITDWEQAYVIFNSNGNQIPASQQTGYLVTEDSWIKDGKVYSELPPVQQIKVHFYNPDDWGTPNIYYYDETVDPKLEDYEWPGVAMKDEGDGWYSYTITGWEKANVLFNSNGKQTPASGQSGYLVTQESWIKDGEVLTEKPEEPIENLVPVTFEVTNAFTVMGQNVYIVGNISELAYWNPENAVGPAGCPNYPTWQITIDLPAGEKIEFKAIKKDAQGNVIWENGSNHSYTVPATGGTVRFNWQ